VNLFGKKKYGGMDEKCTGLTIKIKIYALLLAIMPKSASQVIVELGLFGRIE